MDNGYVILSIIALLFMSMYGFAYSSVMLEKYKEKRAMKESLKLEALKLEEKAKKQQLRNEKLNELTKRSNEIKEELNRLEKIKLGRLEQKVS